MANMKKKVATRKNGGAYGGSSRGSGSRARKKHAESKALSAKRKSDRIKTASGPRPTYKEIAVKTASAAGIPTSIGAAATSAGKRIAKREIRKRLPGTSARDVDSGEFGYKERGTGKMRNSASIKNKKLRKVAEKGYQAYNSGRKVVSKVAKSPVGKTVLKKAGPMGIAYGAYEGVKELSKGIRKRNLTDSNYGKNRRGVSKRTKGTTKK